MAAMGKGTVLITGCSDGGLGSALSFAFQAVGYRVFATARNPAKLAEVKAAGIETLSLDVVSDSSVEKCVEEVRQLTGGSLDILVNNAGSSYYTPLSDASLSEAKKLFDINVWGHLAMIKAFLPLLLKSPGGGMIVNHTSVSSVMAPPFVGLYSASKAALAAMTAVLRNELTPFGTKVIELKSGAVKSNLQANDPRESVSKKSLYYAAHELVDEMTSGDPIMKDATPADVWAKKIVARITQRNPPEVLWVGAWARPMWAASCLPPFVGRTIMRGVARMDDIDKQIQAYGTEKAIKDAYGEQ